MRPQKRCLLSGITDHIHFLVQNKCRSKKKKKVGEGTKLMVKPMQKITVIGKTYIIKMCLKV